MSKTVSVMCLFLLCAVISFAFGCGSSTSSSNGTTSTLSLTSSDITSGGTVGDTYVYDQSGCTGSNLSPQMTWSWSDSALSGLLSYVVTVTDNDSTPANYVHWILYNIPTSVTSLDQGTAAPTGATMALNDYGASQYDGPCPLTGENHTYLFKVWAMSVADLSAVSGFDAASPSAIMTAIEANDLTSANFTATYTGP